MKKSRFTFYAKLLGETVSAEAFSVKYSESPGVIVEARLGNLPVEVKVSASGRRFTWTARLGKAVPVAIGTPSTFRTSAKAFSNAVATISKSILEIRKAA